MFILQRTPSVRLSSIGGGHYFVSKNSPLIKRNIRQRESLARAEINRALNAPLLQRNEEIIPAKYKLIKTSNGFERVLVPAIKGTPPPLIEVPLPRKPFTNINKNLPPALIDTAERNQQITKGRSKSSSSLPPPLVDTAVKAEPSHMSHIIQTRPARPSRPPPLIDTSVKPNLMKRRKNITSRLGPPSLIDTAQGSEPMEVEDVGNYSGPPALIETFRHTARIRPNMKGKQSSNLLTAPPPLMDTSYAKQGPPPLLVDLVSDDEDDVKPMVVHKKFFGRKNSSISLSERFSSIQN